MIYNSIALCNSNAIGLFLYVSLELTEHTESRWCSKEEMRMMNFAEADKPFLKK